MGGGVETPRKSWCERTMTGREKSARECIPRYATKDTATETCSSWRDSSRYILDKCIHVTNWTLGASSLTVKLTATGFIENVCVYLCASLHYLLNLLQTWNHNTKAIVELWKKACKSLLNALARQRASILSVPLYLFKARAWSSHSTYKRKSIKNVFGLRIFCGIRANNNRASGALKVAAIQQV